MAVRSTHAAHIRLGRWIAAIAALLAVALAAPAALAAVPSVRLTGSVPNLLAAGQSLALSGQVRHAPSGSRLQLERRLGAGWHAVAHARLRGATFKLTWSPPPQATLTLRITLRGSGRLLSYSSAFTVRTGRKPRYCPTARVNPASIPAGDGWIYGGEYDSGGPAPGIFECVTAPYTLEALGEGGEAAATLQVGTGDYVLALPPGYYELETVGGCASEAQVKVSAGKGVQANVVCQIP